ncbi:hypothetical protein Sjap_021965 [Stephania japonica]|uniref:Bulb-type lectin domain-containing protein n=1 Tax=Stephania japonica TaxID=461633 RepID=A0AAP0ETP3_9MAGN
MISLLLLCTLFVNHLCSAADVTITPNKFLRNGETIVSKGGTFALRFFSPANSQKQYVGIWFNNVSVQTAVWVANRDNPINNTSTGVVKIDDKGSLGIFNGNSSNPVWSINVSIPISGLFYKLMDSGNLVDSPGEQCHAVRVKDPQHRPKRVSRAFTALDVVSDAVGYKPYVVAHNAFPGIPLPWTQWSFRLTASLAVSSTEIEYQEVFNGVRVKRNGEEGKRSKDWKKKKCSRDDLSLV